MTEHQLTEFLARQRPRPAIQQEARLDRYEVKDGVVHLYTSGRVIRLSFSDIENLAFQIKTWKQLNGYPETSPQFP